MGWGGTDPWAGGAPLPPCVLLMLWCRSLWVVVCGSGLRLQLHDPTVERMKLSYAARGLELNEARLRMVRGEWGLEMGMMNNKRRKPHDSTWQHMARMK